MKKYLKLLFRGLFFLLALPVCIMFWLLAAVSNKDATFAGFSQALSLIPGKIGVYYRAAFYSTVCKNVHRDIVVGFLTVFSHYDIEIEEGVYIGPQCNIGMCRIGKDALVGSGVHILSGKEQHSFEEKDVPIQQQKGQYKKVSIGTNCWIGNQATVLDNIERDCVVGAGSVVVHSSFKTGDIVAGNPARKIKSRI
ncbi:acyltransferase [Salinibius halmophilus]|uniref:acyltransferase n=1 Tax=Salinibius halmophilus TaxID=1853216 RepID=UPI000E66F73F|nr:acyltransferase [Salinibius halmophilus]